MLPYIPYMDPMGYRLWTPKASPGGEFSEGKSSIDFQLPKPHQRKQISSPHIVGIVVAPRQHVLCFSFQIPSPL